MYIHIYIYISSFPSERLYIYLSLLGSTKSVSPFFLEAQSCRMCSRGAVSALVRQALCRVNMKSSRVQTILTIIISPSFLKVDRFARRSTQGHRSAYRSGMASLRVVHLWRDRWTALSEPL